jgi:hypothetical protein
VYPKEYRKLENTAVKKTAFIINESDSIKKELKILKSSDLFTIVNDSTKADIKIKLYPIQKGWVCGQGMIASMVTLGQLPVYFPDRYYYQFDEIEGKFVIKRKIELKIAQRVWFWDMFAFRKNFEKKAGKLLLGEYIQNKRAL